MRSLIKVEHAHGCFWHLMVERECLIKRKRYLDHKRRYTSTKREEIYRQKREVFINTNTAAMPRQALRTSNKRQVSKVLATFGDECSHNGSENGPMAPRLDRGYPQEGAFWGMQPRVG